MTFMSRPEPSGGFEWTQAPWGTALRCEPLEGVAPHLFTTADLVLAADDPAWHAVASAVGVDRSRLRLVRQVHGADVAVCRAGAPPSAISPEADAIISNDPTLAVAVRVADCTPVLLADRRTGAVGAVHAGWRGTMKRAAGRAVDAMRAAFGAEPRDLVAAIGPCLGPCCGEVGPEVLEAFRAAGHDPAALERWFAPGASGRPYLDLWRANRDQLEASGLDRDAIHVSALCTRSHPSLLHSYRVHGAGAGRMAAVIRMRP